MTTRPNDDSPPSPGAMAPLPPGKLPGDLLHYLISTYGTGMDASVVVGPGRGRDAAVVNPAGKLIAAKTDPITFASADASAYLVDVNANDLACLGATPTWLLVTMLLPAHQTTENDVEAQFHGLREVCNARGILLVGGHTEITPAVNWPVLIGTMLGVVTAETLLMPGGAHAGDRLLLSKGVAIEGTALLAREHRDRLKEHLGEEFVARAAALLDDPGISIVQDAETFVQAGGVTALHDPTEGGLATAAQELAAAAGLGLVLIESNIPILPETRAIADALNFDPLGLLASGSLLAAAAPDAVDNIVSTAEAEGIAVCDIGYLTNEPMAWLHHANGTATPLQEFSSDELTKTFS